MVGILVSFLLFSVGFLLGLTLVIMFLFLLLLLRDSIGIEFSWLQLDLGRGARGRQIKGIVNAVVLVSSDTRKQCNHTENESFHATN